MVRNKIYIDDRSNSSDLSVISLGTPENGAQLTRLATGSTRSIVTRQLIFTHYFYYYFY